tara:strand:- start:443 stop:2155 length:1713 start_codon:yes stop_codon:yes gene_type:complete
MSKSIETNNTLIQGNTTNIETINSEIGNLRLGVAVKDQYDRIKYTSFVDWHIRLEIYSNITDTTILNEDLLYSNLIPDYIDYIHLDSHSNLDDENNKKEILYQSNLQFIDYNEIGTTNTLKRDYQLDIYDTYQKYIFNNKPNLLLRYKLNILLKQDHTANLIFPDKLYNFCLFVNYNYVGSNIHNDDDVDNEINLIKGWNTIDYFFIYNDSSDKTIALGFNPILDFEDKIELIYGFLPYNENKLVENNNSLRYTISTKNNNTNNEYIIQQKSKPIVDEPYILTKSFIYNFSNLESVVFDSNINFNFNINSVESIEVSIKLNSITLSNINTESDTKSLSINNFNLHIENMTSNSTLFNDTFNDNQEIKINESYTFNCANSDIEFYNNTFENNIDIDINCNINLSFDNDNTSVLYNIEFEFYLEIRSDNINNNLEFNHKENIDKQTTNNNIIFMNDGSIGIGTDDSKGYSLYVNNISTAKKGIYCADDITILSDQKYKTNIKTIENPIEKLMALRGVSYNRIDRDINETRYGFIAQEVQKIVPEACDGNNGIKTTDIVALLVEGFKELAKKM